MSGLTERGRLPGAEAPTPEPAHAVSASARAAWATPGGLTLILCLVVGAFAFLSSAAVLLFGPSSAVDWGMFLLTLMVLLPGALLAGCYLARVLEDRAGSGAVSALAARAAVGLLAILILSRSVRLLGWPSSTLLLPLIGGWSLALAVATYRGCGVCVSGISAARKLTLSWSVAGALACLCVLAFLPPQLRGAEPLAACLVAAAVLTGLRSSLRRTTGGTWPGRILDILVLGLIVMVVTDVSGYLEYQRPDSMTYVQRGEVATPEFLAFAHRFHADFWLAPLNDMLHGRTLLVETSSQYGVGVLYFLAALFLLAPLGYGPLALVAGFLTALQYALAYGVMRLGGAGRTLAIPAIAAAVVGPLLGPLGSPADFPSLGGLRYGIPWLLVAFAVLSARYGRASRLLGLAAGALVGLSSVWSFETFAYTGAAFTGVVAFDAAILGRGEGRLRAVARPLLAAGGWCALAHLILAVSTRAFGGSWPDWGTYLAFLRAYSTGDLYVLTVAPWSPGLPLLFVHLASGICLAALVASRHELVSARRPLLVGIAATSAPGVVSFSYFVGHSHPTTAKVLALFAVVEVCLWVALVVDPRLRAPRGARLLAVSGAFWIAALLGISGLPDASYKLRRTALAHSIPDGGRGGSIRDALPRLWRSPPSDPRAPEAVALLDRHLPRGKAALVIVEPELTVETLVRGDRVNLLPIGAPEQDNLVRSQVLPKVRRTIDSLRPGTLMLTQPEALKAPVKPIGTRETDRKLVRLQKQASNRIRARFSLREVERIPSGLAIVRLVPRRAR